MTETQNSKIFNTQIFFAIHKNLFIEYAYNLSGETLQTLTVEICGIQCSAVFQPELNSLCRQCY